LGFLLEVFVDVLLDILELSFGQVLFVLVGDLDIEIRQEVMYVNHHTVSSFSNTIHSQGRFLIASVEIQVIYYKIRSFTNTYVEKFSLYNNRHQFA